MNPSRNAKREGQEVTLQYRTHQATLGVEELIEEKLNQLQAFIGQLAQTPHGRSELQRRIKSFGECIRIEGEASGSFYAKLRHWLDRDMPQSKLLQRGSKRNG